ncbi:MAG: hypothetical protein F7C34_00890 [Desulfurococcales archaeon]|nr:hypothetical protein [Desulfurococcales archaeon]
MTVEPPSWKYADLCSKPATIDYALEMVKTYATLGYGLIAMETLPSGLKTVEDAARESGVRIVWRHTIRASSSADVRRGLRNVPGPARLVAVAAMTLEAARYAARSKQVDILVIEPGMERLVDASTLELFTQRGWGAVEIHLSPLLRAFEGPDRRLEAMLRYLFVSMRRATGYRVPLVVSSCAESKWELFHPMHILGLSSLAGIPEEEVLRWLTSVPAAIASRRAGSYRGGTPGGGG